MIQRLARVGYGGLFGARFSQARPRSVHSLISPPDDVFSDACRGYYLFDGSSGKRFLCAFGQTVVAHQDSGYHIFISPELPGAAALSSTHRLQRARLCIRGQEPPGD